MMPTNVTYGHGKLRGRDDGEGEGAAEASTKTDATIHPDDESRLRMGGLSGRGPAAGKLGRKSF